MSIQSRRIDDAIWEQELNLNDLKSQFPAAAEYLAQIFFRGAL